MDNSGYIKPKWLYTFTDFVRPGGIALMFFFITILPLIFAFAELGVKGVGTKLAGVLAGYFQAIPDIYYTTIQVLFVGYAAAKSGEVISGNIANKKPAVIDNAKEVNFKDPRTPEDGAQG